MIKEKCGVYAVKCDEEVFPKLYWGSLAQNHRGHESYGFLTYQNGLRRFVDLGLIPRIEKEDFQRWINLLPGNIGIAHVRYGTSGSRSAGLRYAQPIISSNGMRKIGIAYNGNIVNVGWLKKELKINNEVCDSELLCKYLNLSNDIVECVAKCMENIEGGYSVVGLDSNGNLFAFRDPYGIRPLVYGKLENTIAISSESVGLDINNIKLEGEISPGELLIISKDNIEKIKILKINRRAFCGFEFSYFSRPDSIINGKFVYKVREELGKRLGKRFEDYVRKADLIISIPETADDAAYGLHEETGLRWERALRRHRFVTHRAFIMNPNDRSSIINMKINIADNISGKNVIVVEDSIVRGDTTKIIVKKLRKAGANKIFLFVTFPKITHPCFYGIDMATFSELIGFSTSNEEIAKLIGVDAVCYQENEDFVNIIGGNLCMACTTGIYPTKIAQEIANKGKLIPNNKSRIYEYFEV
ncbi:MAG: amidophosphoribosyltransferase [Candidatus Methanomethylicaceae archaeon]|nr:amidophosphoribosyltransferase [Candidatus Verstraetearchaeota archaeon]